MNKNIRTAYVLTFLNELYFPVSIWLFYYLRFMDFKHIAVLTSIKVLASNIFEIPTGAFADIYGRKTSVLLSFSLYGLVMFGFAFNQVFWIFIVLDILKALSSALYSGSMEALVYDTLKQEKKEKSFDNVIANMETYAWIALFIASILGGFFYYYHFNIPYVVQGITYLIAAVLALRLVEPEVESSKYQIQDMWKKNIEGIKELTKSIRILQISLIFVTLGAGYFIASELLGISQAKQYGMDSRAVGIFFAVGYLISAFASQAYPYLRNKLGSKILLITVGGILISSFIFAKFVGLFIGCLLIISRISSSTTFRNVRSSIMNRYFSSGNRATAISTLVLLSQLPYAVFAYSMGSYIDNTSPNDLAFILGISLSVLLTGQYIFFYIFNNLKNKL